MGTTEHDAGNPLPAWLEATGRTYAQAAAILGVTEDYVRKVAKGRRPCPEEWPPKLRMASDEIVRGIARATPGGMVAAGDVALAAIPPYAYRIVPVARDVDTEDLVRGDRLVFLDRGEAQRQVERMTARWLDLCDDADPDEELFEINRIPWDETYSDMLTLAEMSEALGALPFGGALASRLEDAAAERCEAEGAKEAWEKVSFEVFQIQSSLTGSPYGDLTLDMSVLMTQADKVADVVARARRYSHHNMQPDAHSLIRGLFPEAVRAFEEVSRHVRREVGNTIIRSGHPVKVVAVSRDGAHVCLDTQTTGLMGRWWTTSHILAHDEALERCKTIADVEALLGPQTIPQRFSPRPDAAA